MSMTMELKCCPFCGGEAESDSQRGYRNISTGNPENAAAIYCTKCNADMTWCYRDTPEIERDQVMTLLIEQWNTRATASLQCEDAVERVARIIDPEAWSLDAWNDNWRAVKEGRQEKARTKARAIIATGLVPGEAARPLGDVFNELVRRMNFDGMDPRTFTLGELERAIDGAEFPK